MFRIFTALLVLMLLVLGVAWWREWFTVAVTHPGDDRTDVEVAVHRDKFHEDVDRLRKGVQKAAPTEVKATLAAVDTARKRIELQEERGIVSLEANDDTDIRIGGRKAGLADLRPGMKVAVAYTDRDGRKLAQSIHVEREAP